MVLAFSHYDVQVVSLFPPLKKLSMHSLPIGNQLRYKEKTYSECALRPALAHPEICCGHSNGLPVLPESCCSFAFAAWKPAASTEKTLCGCLMWLMWLTPVSGIGYFQEYSGVSLNTLLPLRKLLPESLKTRAVVLESFKRACILSRLACIFLKLACCWNLGPGVRYSPRYNVWGVIHHYSTTKCNWRM